MTHYYYCVWPMLGVSKFDIRIILFGCVACLNQLDNMWDSTINNILNKKRYSRVYYLKHFLILGEYNNWIIMDILENVKMGMRLETSSEDTWYYCIEYFPTIKYQAIGQTYANGINSYVYYIVKFLSLPYTLHERKIFYGLIFYK